MENIYGGNNVWHAAYSNLGKKVAKHSKRIMGLQPRPNKVQTDPIELDQNKRNQSLAHDLIKVNEISLL